MTLNNFIIDANITWDRVSKSIFEKPQAKPGRKLRVQVTNAGVVDNLTGYTLHLGWRNSVNGIEGLDIFTAVDATKGLFELQYTEGMLSNAGSLRASLVLVNIADVTIAESNDFVIRVTPSPFSQDASQSTTSLTSLAEILLNEASREQAAAEQAAAFETYDQRIEQLETGVKHEVTNIITTNSDFATTDGFALFGASVATANNVMTITGTGSSSLPNAGFSLPNIPTGAKVYMRVWARVLNAVCNKISIRSESTEIASKVNPIENQWYEIAAIRTKTGALETALNMAMTHTYADSATANGKQMEVKWAVAIQLTEDFGAGMEPTTDYTTFMLNIYDNKYFSGTATVYPVQSVAENLASVEQRIDDRFDEFVESNIVPETVTQKMLDFESASGGRLVSVEQQLAETATKAELSAIATPKAVSLATQMTDVTKIYVYTGVEVGYTAGNWYYHNGTEWVSGGVYQSTGITDGSITEAKLSTAAVTNAKLGDRYNAVRLLTAGENVLSIYREGVYYKETATSVVGLPTELSVDKSVFLEVSAYNNLNYVQTAIDTVDHNYTYVRVVRAGVDKGWIKYASEAKIDAKLALTHVTDTERMLKNFEKYRADTPTSTLYDMMAAIQDIEVIGLDPSLPLKFWVVCRQYGAWGYRIMMGQKVDGVWVTVLDTGTTISVTESALGSTYYSFTSSGGVTLRMRIDYRAIPEGGRILQGASMAEEPYYIISPKCVKLTDTPEVVAEAYDQSLNTTDSVQFNAVTATTIIADTLQVGGTIPTGTLAIPPTGLLSGDMWADTTDSTIHPIVRVML